MVFIYPNLACLSSQLERCQALVVLAVLQPQLGMESCGEAEDVVVHGGDEGGVLGAVVGHHHQSVQHHVPLRVPLPDICSLVLVLQQEIHHRLLVGAGRQRQRQLPCSQKSVPYQRFEKLF